MPALVLKATGRCNSRCRYCDERQRGRGGEISLELVDLILSRVDAYLRGRPDQRVELLWHGGEPLLLGVPFFRGVLELQRQRCLQVIGRIGHGIQTNLTALEEPFLPILRALGITEVGTSYDPLPGMRGTGGESGSVRYNRRFMRGIELLERGGLGWGLIYVVTRPALPRARESFFFLTNLNLPGRISITPVALTSGAEPELSISPQQFADYLGSIFPIWWRHRARYPAVQPFALLAQQVAGTAKAAAPADDHLVVDAEGSVGPAAEGPSLGNLADASLERLLDRNHALRSEARARLRRDPECADCRLWELCLGGGAQDAFGAVTAPDAATGARTPWCRARRAFVEQHLEPVIGASLEPRS